MISGDNEDDEVTYLELDESEGDNLKRRAK